MKTEDVKTLKALSTKAIHAIPRNISVNGKGVFFRNGKEINPMLLLSDIEMAVEAIDELDAVIQNLKERKSLVSKSDASMANGL